MLLVTSMMKRSTADRTERIPEAEMTRTGSTVRRTLTIFLAIGAGMLALSAPAWSATSETQQGAQIVSEVQSGKLSGSSLSSEQYTHVGQYLMSRAFSSTQTYEAMDSRMDEMMGTTGSDRMYRYLGERYFGNNVQPEGGYTSMYGRIGGMMGSYGASGGYAVMMGRYLQEGPENSTNGSYPMMGRGGMMGTYANQSSSSSGGWPTGAIVAVAVSVALLIGGLVFLATPRLRGRGGHPAAHGPS
jgi:hypothetical protein